MSTHEREHGYEPERHEPGHDSRTERELLDDSRELLRRVDMTRQ